MKIAGQLVGVPVVFLGYGFNGGFDQCLPIAQNLRLGVLPDPSIKSLEIFRPFKKGV
jgi:hypothetical protein